MSGAGGGAQEPPERKGTGIRIRPMEPRDIARVVRIHLDAFPGFFLSFLGPRFLGLLYGEILEEGEHVALVAERGPEAVVGFVAGVRNQDGFYGRMVRRRWAAFAVASLAAALRRPAVIPRLFRALGRARAARDAEAPALLMSIAVIPGASGGGIGKRLVDGFLSAMHALGASRVSLATDRDGNDRVNRFYGSLGFRIARSHATQEGRWMNEYVMDLEGWSGPREGR